MTFNGLIHWTSVLTIVLMAAATRPASPASSRCATAR